MNKFRQILISNVWIAIILFIGFLGWGVSLEFLSIPLIAVYSLLLMIFCEDIKNIFVVFFAVPFFIGSVKNTSDIILLGISFGIFLVGVVFYLIKQLIKSKNCKKGKLFWGFVCLLITYLVGGIIGYFNILNWLIIIAMTLLTYFCYWVAINFCHNLKKHIIYTFISIGILLSIQLFISYLAVEEPFSLAILSKNVITIGLQNINVVAIYFMLAMISTFYLGYKHKYDYLYTFACSFFAIATYFTYSRMGTLICLILFIVATIATLIKSTNKKIYISIIVIGVVGLIVVFTVFYERIYKYLEWHIDLGFSGNGRGTLWPWCLDKFLESPIFGVGFTSEDPVPSLITTDSIILAHNSVLQYLTSTGIVGSAIVLYFYYQKYKIALVNFNSFKFFNLLNILAIAISGITDQSPTMDLFILTISAILVALAEIDSESNPSKKVVGFGDKTILELDSINNNKNL